MIVVTEGTTTPGSLNSPATLYTASTAGTYILLVDTSNMVNGDSVKFEIKAKVRSSGTNRIAQYVEYAHAQADNYKFSVPLPMPQGGTFELTQTGGTLRAFDWAVLSL